MYQAPVKQRLRPRTPALSYYLGEDEHAYYFVNELGGFGKTFKRMIKVTPKSFRPGNVFKAITNVTATVATGGLYQALPSNLKNKIENIGKIAVPLIGGAALAIVAGPAVISVLGPKLAMAGSLLGKATSTIGGQLFGFMNALPPAQQAQVAEQITPQQIAQIEQTGQIPPTLEAILNRAAMQAAPPPMTFGPMKPDTEPGAPVTEAGMFGSGNMGLIVFAGLSLAAFVFMGMPGARRR